MSVEVRSIDRARLCRAVSEADLDPINQRFKELAEKLPLMERRRPLVVEFSGIPKAGKTGVRSAIAHLAMKSGFRVLYPAEGASLPEQRALRENLIAFNAWTGMYALQNVLSACYPVNQYDLVMLDRGLIDAICWMEMLARQNFVCKEAAEAAKNFFGLHEWLRLVDMAVIFECDQLTALAREQSGAICKARLERTGPLVDSLREVLNDEVLLRGIHTRGGVVLRVDTSDCKDSRTNKKAVALSIAEELSKMLMDAVDPRYVTIPSTCVNFKGFRTASTSPTVEWMKARRITKASDAEENLELKQIVSYGFIERGGEVFRVKRTGRANRPELKTKLSIGIGGHLEERDLEGSVCLEDALKECLTRELSEELLIDERPEIELLGFINDESIPAGRQHLAAFHRVKLHRGSVRVRQEVSDQEFGEASWGVVSPQRLFEEINKFDPWSQIIMESVLGGPKPTEQQTFMPLDSP